MKHENISSCPRCLLKLEDADPHLAFWFHRIKEFFPTVHLSCVYRGKDEQNKAFTANLSKFKWPYSKHNVKPSLAMDLFSLEENGKASFRTGFFVQVANFLEDENAPINWGGHFKHFPDLVHFELKEKSPGVSPEAS